MLGLPKFPKCPHVPRLSALHFTLHYGQSVAQSATPGIIPHIITDRRHLGHKAREAAPPGLTRLAETCAPVLPAPDPTNS